MTAINIQTGSVNPRIGWEPVDSITDCQQETIIISNSGTAGEVDLLYYAPMSLRAQYMAWKGIQGDQRIWFNSFDGSNWVPQRRVQGVETSVGPSIMFYSDIGKQCMAWKGIQGDQRIWFNSFDGSNWVPQQQVPGVGTSVGPSLAVFNGTLYMAWKGKIGRA